MAKPKKKSPSKKPALKKKVAPKKVAKKPAPKKVAKKAKKPAPKKVAKKPAPKKVAKKPAAKKKPSPTKKPAPKREVRHRVETDESREKVTELRETAIGQDDVGRELAEDYVRTATGGEEAQEERDELVDEEAGGPFVTTSARTEMASGTDASNPEDAEVAALPHVLSEEDDEDVDEEIEESE